jgi:D-alanyl-D-alanine carboxypeptidase
MIRLAGVLSLALAALTLAPVGPSAQAGGSLSPALADELQAIVEKARTGPAVPGISAAVQLRDGTTWTGVSGKAVLEGDGRRVTPDTPFEIASGTKTFVAATILQLAQEGALRLGDRLARWLPHFPRARRITLHHLLSHTSGIRDIFMGHNYRARVLRRPTHAWTFREILTMVGPPRFEPGHGWEYSNTNYVLLGRVIEVVTGQSVSAEIRHRFLEPLGLTSTWFQGEESVPVTVAMGYRRRSGRWRPESNGAGLLPTTSLATFVWAAGAMVSTPRDLVTWARALYGGRVLSARSTRRLLRFNHHDYGLGVRRTWMGRRRAFGHGGSLDGYETSMWYLPRLDAAVAVTWNRWPLETDRLANALARRVVRELDMDTNPPGVQAPRLAIRAGARVVDGLVPAVVSWHARAAAPVVRFQLRRRKDGGRWKRIALPRPRAGSIDVDLPRDQRLTFAVRAVDAEGDVSPWVKSVTVVPRIVDDRSLAIHFTGSWQRRAARGALERGVMATRVGGSAAGLRWQGVAVGVVSMRAPSRGQMLVDAGGEGALPINLRAPTRSAGVVVVVRAWRVAAHHHLLVTAVGAPGRPRVDIDGFVILEAAPRAPRASGPPG